jgi:hypothetical protein
MAREARVVVELLDEVDAMQVKRALKHAGDRFDVERSGIEIQCYVNAPDDPADTSRGLETFLIERGFHDRIAYPPRTEWWDESAYQYVDQEHAPLNSFAPLTDVTWHVIVEPTAIFDWRAARREVLGARPPLKENRKLLVIPAQDEADAVLIAATLRRLSGLGPMHLEKLGAFRRWRARQRTFGSYESGGS